MRPDSTAPEFWGSQAATYDDLIRRTVPCYDTMTGRLVASLPRARRVLELGCGTGNLSVLLARALPDASLTFVDGSPAMTAVTKARLASEAPGVDASFVDARFEDLDDGGEPWDLAVASISLHHLPDPAPFYGLLGRIVAPGGAFRMADAIRAVHPDHHARHVHEFHSFWEQPGNLDPDERAAVYDHVIRHDHYFTLDEHFAWLRAAGFERCDCLWRDGLFAVVTADRT